MAVRQEGKKEEVRKGCLTRQGRIGRDSEYGDGGEYAVVAVGKDWWRD